MSWPGMTVAGLAAVPVSGTEDLCALMTGNTTSWCVVFVSQVLASVTVQPGVWTLVTDAVLSISFDCTSGVVTEKVSDSVVGVVVSPSVVAAGTVRCQVMVVTPLPSVGVDTVQSGAEPQEASLSYAVPAGTLSCTVTPVASCRPELVTVTV